MYFSKEIADQAIHAVRPMLEALIKAKGLENGLLPNGNGFHIIVGDIDGRIIRDFDYKDRDVWVGPYNDIAVDKFELTVEHKMSTRKIQLLYPELAEARMLIQRTGHTYYWGSWIDGGIVVACSGIDPEWDEFFSKVICAFIRAAVSKKVKLEAVAGKHFRD
jgi:hypothetical protein